MRKFTPQEAKESGEVLRYVAVVDVEAGTCEVVMRKYPKDHPFAALKVILPINEWPIPCCARGDDVHYESAALSLRSRQLRHLGHIPYVQGSDNIVQFTTERYDSNPLIIRGPGAGAAVTAAGVFSDTLHCATHLGAGAL